MKKCIILSTIVTIMSLMIVCDKHEAKAYQGILFDNITNYLSPLTRILDITLKNSVVEIFGDKGDAKEVFQIDYDIKENGEDWCVFMQDGKYGYMDKDGDIKIDAQFNWARDFVDGVAAVGNYIDNYIDFPSGTNIIRWGFVDTKGEMITPIKFSYVWNFSNGLALVKETDGSDPYYIDKEGNKSSQKFMGERFLKDGVAPVRLKCDTNLWSYVDSNGDLETDKKYEDAKTFEDGLAIVKINGKYGLIDTDFNIVIDFKYDDLIKVDKTLFAAKMGENWGIIDRMDTVIADFEYFYIGFFSDGIAAIRRTIDDGAYMDTNGEIILDLGFSMTYGFVGEYACVKEKYSGEYGVINRNGDYVIEPTYHSLLPSKNGLFKVQDESGNDYYINYKNEKIIPH